MRSELLIDRLVGDLKPVRRRRMTTDVVIVATLSAIELALFLMIGAERSDLPVAVTLPSFWWKLGSLGAIAAVSGAVAILSFDPTEKPRRGLRLLVAMTVLCAVPALLIDAVPDGFAGLASRLSWRDGIDCVCHIAALSAPPVIGLGWLMRRGAPTDAGGTALAVGATAAAWGGFVFVFACPQDDPVYVVVWYAVGCGLVIAAARWMLPRLTRW